METSHMRRKIEAKRDLIRAIHNSDIYDLLDLDMYQTEWEMESWDLFMKALKEVAGEVKCGTPAAAVEESAQNYGNAREESGFKNGFHLAMRLCMEGLKGGAC